MTHNVLQYSTQRGERTAHFTMRMPETVRSDIHSAAVADGRSDSDYALRLIVNGLAANPASALAANLATATTAPARPSWEVCG